MNIHIIPGGTVELDAENLSFHNYVTHIILTPFLRVDYICLEERDAGEGHKLTVTDDDVKTVAAHFSDDAVENIIKRPGHLYQATVITDPRRGVGERHKIDTWTNYGITDNSNNSVSPLFINGSYVNSMQVSDISGLSGSDALVQVMQDHQKTVAETAQELYSFAKKAVK